MTALDELQMRLATQAQTIDELRKELESLQEIVLLVKKGQLETWPDASRTQLGRGYMDLTRRQRNAVESLRALQSIVHLHAARMKPEDLRRALCAAVISDLDDIIKELDT